MRYRDDEELMIERARVLAAQCHSAGVKKNQVHQVLAHLESHRDVAATSRLLDELVGSCFADRSRSTKRQLEGLRTHIGQALRGQSNWRQMARLLGWICRCMEARRDR